MATVLLASTADTDAIRLSGRTPHRPGTRHDRRAVIYVAADGSRLRLAAMLRALAEQLEHRGSS
ncbi:MAG: hypothetical protein ABI990_01625 [Actinomycetota bacterium]